MENLYGAFFILCYTYFNYGENKGKMTGDEEFHYDDFLGTYDSLYWYYIRSSLCAVYEKGAKARGTEGPSWLCGRGYGCSVCVVASNSGYGYVRTNGKICFFSCGSGISGWNRISLVGSEETEGPRCVLNRSTMLVMAVTIHNIPEGISSGAVFAGLLTDNADVTIAGAFTLAAGIAIQNLPEGFIVSLPVQNEGGSRGKAFLYGTLSGIVEPIAGGITVLLAAYITPVLPYLLAFAAGAMIYVVVEELVPESAEGGHSNIGTIGFAAGFVLMMILDVALG